MDRDRASLHDKTSSHDSGTCFVPDVLMDSSDLSSAFQKMALPVLEEIINTNGGPYQYLQKSMPDKHDRNLFAQWLAQQFALQDDVEYVHGFLAGVEEEQRSAAAPQCVHITSLGFGDW